MDSLASTTLIPNSAVLRRLLSRLPKPVLVDLALLWLDHRLCPLHGPIDDEDEYFEQSEPETLEDIKARYESFRTDSNASKKVVTDRILGTEWVCCVDNKYLGVDC